VVKHTMLALGLFVSVTIFAQAANHEAPGNLKSDTQVPPSEIQDITNMHNPVDIFPLVRAKIKQKKYDEAAVAYLIAHAYGTYDTYRVEDKSAHDAVTVLGMRTLGDLSAQQQEQFLDAVDLLLKDKEKVLGILAKVGKPTYYPKYMVQHGMDAFTGHKSKDGLVPGFDPDKAWQETLSVIFPSQ